MSLHAPWTCVTCVHYIVCWIISFSSSHLFIFCCQLTHRWVRYTHIVSAPSLYPVHNPLLPTICQPPVSRWCDGRCASLEDRCIVRHQSYHSIQLPDGIIMQYILLSQGRMMVCCVQSVALVIGASAGAMKRSVTNDRSALSHSVYNGLQKLQKALAFATIFATSVAKWP